MYIKRMCKKLIFRNESVSNKFMASKILRELQCQSSRYIMSEYNIQTHKNFYFLQQYIEKIFPIRIMFFVYEINMFDDKMFNL